jgi:hypothetical protein
MRIRKRLSAAFFLALALTAVASPAAAWSAKGHRIIAELAERELSPQTLAAIRTLLADEPTPTLAGVATWADEVRDQEAWRHTARWHFVNFPRGDCRYRAARDCADGRCIVAAIESQRAVLADRRAPAAQRVQALKFVVHMVGDIHQPLHAGYGDDRGGNDTQIRFDRQGSNLHALWDGLLLDTRRLDWQEHARVIAATGPLPAAGSMRGPVAQGWAEESCTVLDSARVYPGERRIDRSYVERSLPVAEARMKLAAARLAATLEAALSR